MYNWIVKREAKAPLDKNLDFICDTFGYTWSCGSWSWIPWIFKFLALHISVWNFFHLVIFWTSKVCGNDNSNGQHIFLLFNILSLLIRAISIAFQNTLTSVFCVLIHHHLDYILTSFAFHIRADCGTLCLDSIFSLRASHISLSFC